MTRHRTDSSCDQVLGSAFPRDRSNPMNFLSHYLTSVKRPPLALFCCLGVVVPTHNDAKYNWTVVATPISFVGINSSCHVFSHTLNLRRITVADEVPMNVIFLFNTSFLKWHYQICLFIHGIFIERLWWTPNPNPEAWKLCNPTSGLPRVIPDNVSPVINFKPQTPTCLI